MKIERHWLVAESPSEKISKVPTPNYQYQIMPKYLMIHYTATDTASSAITWFKQTASQGNSDRVCAHIVLAPDGTITQMAPFNTRCNHAGYSAWDGRTGMNEHAIGIEIVNPGYCEKLGNGSYRRAIANKPDGTPIYKTYPSSEKSRIVPLKHKHKFWTGKDNQHWFLFTPEQIAAAAKLSKLLIDHYQLSFVVGHDDVSPGRKPDPGPAFPWDEFKSKVFGQPDSIGKIFVVSSLTDGYANFRTQAGSGSTVIKKLKTGYEVGLVETYGRWCRVYLVNDIKDVKNGKHSIKTEGWVHASLLVPKP